MLNRYELLLGEDIAIQENKKKLSSHSKIVFRRQPEKQLMSRMHAIIDACSILIHIAKLLFVLLARSNDEVYKKGEGTPHDAY